MVRVQGRALSMIEKQTLIAQAREALGQSRSPEELLTLARALKAENLFGFARRLLEKARASGTQDKKLQLDLRRELALTTSKDVDLPAATRHDQAIAVLAPEDPALHALETDEDIYTLLQSSQPRHGPYPAREYLADLMGTAGGIYKRKWESDGQRANLERALACYQRAYRTPNGPRFAFRNGYPAINAAFLLDLLAADERARGPNIPGARRNGDAWREEAQEIRRALVEVLPQQPDYATHYWTQATHAEALLGLGRYAEAREVLRSAAALGPANWQRGVTERQLAHLCRVQGRLHSEEERAAASAALSGFFGASPEAVHSAFQGKVGLALSGGGFRASLFHIGVLAKLAELDVLRSVEVISCVSGGSIVGAAYYLEVKRLLEQVPDHQIRREHYVQVVRRVMVRFLALSRRNIRTRIIASLRQNLRMFFEGTTRTELLAELLERRLYSRVRDGKGERPQALRHLRIRPMGASGAPLHEFDPKHQNGARGAKVPILVLNATTLNTGHNWQFTASYMGEPLAAIDPEVDGNRRLRRMYYEDAPGPHKDLRLATAVAASACVPGLFQPIALEGLYPERTVRLVDGGVHDNQGTTGLLEQNCTVVLVSDASGQSESQDAPSGRFWAAPLRSNGVLMARVRQAEYRELVALQRSGLLQGMAFIHLKKELDFGPVDWVGCQEPSLEAAATQAKDDEPTSYGVLKGVQRRLAALRTDLDSFSEAEAFALMTSGYLMMGKELASRLPHLAPRTQAPARWRFLEIERALRGPDAENSPTRRLVEQLDRGSHRLFRALRRGGSARMDGGLLEKLTGLLRHGTALPLRLLVWAAVLVPALVLSVGMAALANLHLRFLDRLFLERGSLARLFVNVIPFPRLRSGSSGAAGMPAEKENAPKRRAE